MSFYLILNFILHLLLALILPISNDEAYYWEWGQWLQWSYFDHPPGISWMTGIASYFFDGKLGIRLLSPFLHTLLLAIQFRILDTLPTSDQQQRRSQLFWLWLSSPGLFLMGSLALPDMGLWVFIQLGLWYSLVLASRTELKAAEGLLWGALLGAAALFKYHAFPMGFSIGVGLLFLRLRQGKHEPMFFITGLMAALVILSPLWIWNIQHEWASFRFQAAHGFAAGQFSLLYPIQATLACALVVGPPLLIQSLRCFWPKKAWLSDPLTLLTLPAVFSILFLIASAALRKPILPHWILPAFSLALPWLVSQKIMAFKNARWWRWQLGYGSAVLMVAIVLLNPWTLRSILVPMFRGDPGPLTEITVWDQLAPELRKQLHHWEARLPHNDATCESGLALATYRWWGAAQLHLRLKDRSPVLSLQDLKAGFYNERDKDRTQTGCPVAVVLTGDQWQKRAGLEQIEVLWQEPLVVPQHEKQSWVLVLGHWTNPSS